LPPDAAEAPERAAALERPGFGRPDESALERRDYAAERLADVGRFGDQRRVVAQLRFRPA
jgi:hypothetical protein